MFTPTRARLTTNTKQARLDTADFATRTWRWHTNTTASAQCLICGRWIPATRRVVAGELEPWATALAGDMALHLDGDCPGVTP